MVCFIVQVSLFEQWNFQNGWNWLYLIYVYMEEYQVIKGVFGLYGSNVDDGVNYSCWGSQYCWLGCVVVLEMGVNLLCKDMVWLVLKSSVSIKMWFCDWQGCYVMYCYNVIYEDYVMMICFDIVFIGDIKLNF